MSLAKKLNPKDGMKVRVVGKPASVDPDDVGSTSAASAEGINRDILRKHRLPHGIQRVRQLAIDDIWSAVPFRQPER
jgi:hypothetical protein